MNMYSKNRYKLIFSLMVIASLFAWIYSFVYIAKYTEIQSISVEVNSSKNTTNVKMQRLPQVIIIGVSKCGKYLLYK